MFREPWLWLLFTSFFFNTYYTLAANRNGVEVGKIGPLTTLGQIIFLLFGFFYARHWWEPLVAIIVFYIGGGLIGALIPERFKKPIGMIGQVLGPIFLIAAYIVWF